MLRQDKERIVAELVERLRSSQSLLVADYRGLTMSEIDELRSKLLESGARFAVVKNTLTRRAAEEAGMQALLELIDGPTAIAFIGVDGDPAAAKGRYIHSVTLTSSMGPGIKVDPARTRGIVDELEEAPAETAA